MSDDHVSVPAVPPPPTIAPTEQAALQQAVRREWRRGNRPSRKEHPRAGCELPAMGRRHNRLYCSILALRRAIESECERRGIVLGPLEHSRILTICRLEASIRLLERQLRDTDFPAAELRGHRESVCRWSREKDNALASLLGSRAAGGDAIDWHGIVDDAYRQSKSTQETSGNE